MTISLVCWYVSKGPTRRDPPAGDVVRATVSNSEHLEPSHNIKDIIKQYQANPVKPTEIPRWEMNIFRSKSQFHIFNNEWPELKTDTQLTNVLFDLATKHW